MLVKASLSGRLVLLSKLNSYYALSVGLLCMRRSNIVPMLQNREEYLYSQYPRRLRLWKYSREFTNFILVSSRGLPPCESMFQPRQQILHHRHLREIKPQPAVADGFITSLATSKGQDGQPGINIAALLRLNFINMVSFQVLCPGRGIKKSAQPIANLQRARHHISSTCAPMLSAFCSIS